METLFERLRVWQLAHELTLGIYKATAGFPSSEKYGLTAQLRRYLLRLSRDLGILSPEKYERLFEGDNEVGKMVQGLINRLDHPGSSNP